MNYKALGVRTTSRPMLNGSERERMLRVCLQSTASASRRQPVRVPANLCKGPCFNVFHAHIS